MAQSINPVRNRLLAGILFQISGAGSPNEYAVWCSLWWLTLHPYMEAEDKPNGKWINFLKGSTPHCLDLLAARFPPLRRAMEDSLWDVLAWDGKNQTQIHDFLMGRLGKGDMFLPRASQTVVNSRMFSLMGVPSWNGLALALSLLMSRSRAFYRHRAWLQKHFTVYFTLACTQGSVGGAMYGLYELVDELVQNDIVKRPKDWPLHLQHFDAYMDDWEEVYAILPTIQWFAEGTPEWELVGTLWCLHLKGGSLLNELMKRLDPAEIRYPRILRQRLNSIAPQDLSIHEPHLGMDFKAAYRP